MSFRRAKPKQKVNVRNTRNLETITEIKAGMQTVHGALDRYLAAMEAVAMPPILISLGKPNVRHAEKAGARDALIRASELVPGQSGLLGEHSVPLLCRHMRPPSG